MPKVLLQSTDNKEPVTVELARHADGENGAIDVRIAETRVEVEIIKRDASCGCLRLHGRVLPYYTVRNNDAISVWVDGKTHVFRLIEQTARRATEARATAAAADTLIAPMPGTILKINAKPGDPYQAHQPLIIMESMKMEMTLSSPQPGQVAELHCKVGELVALGKVLATLKAEKEPDAADADHDGQTK